MKEGQWDKDPKSLTTPQVRVIDGGPVVLKSNPQTSHPAQRGSEDNQRCEQSTCKGAQVERHSAVDARTTPTAWARARDLLAPRVSPRRVSMDPVRWPPAVSAARPPRRDREQRRCGHDR